MKYDPINTKINPKHHPVGKEGQTEEEKQAKLKAAEEKRVRQSVKRS